MWGVGIIALFVGVILAVCGAVGRGVGDRRQYYQERAGVVVRGR